MAGGVPPDMSIEIPRSDVFESREPRGDGRPSSDVDCEADDIGSPGSPSARPRSVKFWADEPPSSNSTESCFAIELRVKLVDAAALLSVSSPRKMSPMDDPRPLLLDVLVSPPDVTLPQAHGACCTACPWWLLGTHAALLHALSPPQKVARLRTSLSCSPAKLACSEAPNASYVLVVEGGAPKILCCGCCGCCGSGGGCCCIPCPGRSAGGSICGGGQVAEPSETGIAAGEGTAEACVDGRAEESNDDAVEGIRLLLGEVAACISDAMPEGDAAGCPEDNAMPTIG